MSLIPQKGLVLDWRVTRNKHQKKKRQMRRTERWESLATLQKLAMRNFIYCKVKLTETHTCETLEANKCSKDFNDIWKLTSHRMNTTAITANMVQAQNISHPHSVMNQICLLQKAVQELSELLVVVWSLINWITKD